MWLLSEEVEPEALANLNQRVTYFADADKGGWSLTKVLRVPGSISTKRLDDFRVRLMWWKDRSYDPQFIEELTRKVKTPASTVKELGDLKLPKAPPKRILRRYGNKVPARARKLLRMEEARGDRSERLWQLECDLLSAGMKPEQVLVIVRESVWNKYAGQRRELKQLWTEIGKAASSMAPRKSGSAASRRKQNGSASRRKEDQRSAETSSTGSSSKKRKSSSSSSTSDRRLTTYKSFMSKRIERPGWMVEGVWSQAAHGVLAGEAKTYKSVISTDLAISVASGTHFLGTFPIPATGRVIMIQEENDPGEFQDRMQRIANSRGLGGSVHLSNNGIRVKPSAELPIDVMNNRGFDLTSKTDMTWLARQCEKIQPALIILDPFYLLTPGVDENSQAQVTPILKNLLKLKQEFKVGIQIIHHYRKQNVMAPTSGAQRMSGTGVFHRWFESAVYVEKTSDETTVRLVPDHRGHAPQGAMRVTFDLGSEDDLDYWVNVYQAKADKAQMHNRLRDLMKEQDEWQLNELRVAMGISSTKALKQMIDDHAELIIEVRHSGMRGRPAKIVRFISDRGSKSRSTQAGLHKTR
jgi:hypothetical protein